MTAERTFFDHAVDYIDSLNIDARRRLAEFLNVKEQTIRSWQRKKTVPSGVRVLRFYYLLEAAGVQISGWRCTDPILQAAGRLVAFGVLGLAEMATAFDDDVVDGARVLQFLCGHVHVKPKNMGIFKLIVENHIDMLPEKQREWEDLYRRDKHDVTIVELANRINEILPMCEEMVTDKWSASERHQLRERCGPDVVFRLYNAMGALCGEAAREHQLRNVASFIIR